MKITNPDNTFFTSDLHFGHRFMAASRGFASMDYDEFLAQRDAGATSRELVTDAELSSMHTAMIDMVNAKVGKDDRLFIVGDFSMHLKASAVEGFLTQFNSTEIHLVRGNHDDYKACKDVGFASVRDRIVLSHKSNGERHMLICDHFPILSWQDCHKGSIHLHGHSHGGGDNGNVKRFDVGIDSPEVHIALGRLNENRLVDPVSFTEVIEAGKTRTGFVEYDHHAPGV